MSPSVYALARAHNHLVQSPGGRAPAHCIKPLWVCTAQTLFGLAPYRRTQKHKALVGSHRTDVQARLFTHAPARAHKHLAQDPGGRAPAHCISPCVFAPHKALLGSHSTDVHRSTKPWWACTVQMYRLAHMSLSTHVPARARKRMVQSRGGEDRTEVLTISHGLLCTRSHTRAQNIRPHSHMLPPTSRIKHYTGTSSLLSHIAQSARGRALHRMYARPLLGPICMHVLHEACGRISHKSTCSRTRAILVPYTGTVRSAGSFTHVAPNKPLFYAHMFGT